MILGITGGTGCGKTTALQVIREHGGLILDCDAIYHRLLREDTALLSAIGDRFPGVVSGGELDRKALGRVVFADPEALEDLNRITHRAVYAAVEQALASAPPLAAIDAIALFESGLSELCQVTVGIVAPERDRIARLMARDSIPEDYALARIRAQKPEAYFRAHCDHILENSGSQAAFREKCLAFFRKSGIIRA